MVAVSTLPLLGGALRCSDCVAVCDAALRDAAQDPVPVESSGCCNDDSAAGGEEFLDIQDVKEVRGASWLPDEAGGRYVLPVLLGDQDEWGADAVRVERAAGLVALLVALVVACADQADRGDPLLLDEALDVDMEP